MSDISSYSKPDISVFLPIMPYKFNKMIRVKNIEIRHHST